MTQVGEVQAVRHGARDTTADRVPIKINPEPMLDDGKKIRGFTYRVAKSLVGSQSVLRTATVFSSF